MGREREENERLRCFLLRGREEITSADLVLRGDLSSLETCAGACLHCLPCLGGGHGATSYMVVLTAVVVMTPRPHQLLSLVRGWREGQTYQVALAPSGWRDASLL